MARPTVSLVTTVYNEEDSIAAFLDALLSQHRKPDEIIIVDAGSKDRTRAIIEDYIARGLRARLLVEPGANRARGRNLGIANASGSVIACTDAGCVPEPDWLARIAAPFRRKQAPDVVSGYYRAEARSLTEQAIAAATVPGVDEVDPEKFDPSSRSVAFAREAWREVGGYPEYVDYAEDTEFDRRLRAAGCRFQFEPRAIVRWRMQGSLAGLFRQFARYARSDGELGHWFGHYAKAFVGVLAVGIVAALTAWRAWAGLAYAPLAALYWARYVSRARRRGARWPAALLAPLAMLTVDAAHVIGYSAGLLRRRPRPGKLPDWRPLSVAQVTYTYKPIVGGADVYVSQLADLIVDGGHEHVVYQRRSRTTAPEVRFVPNPTRNRPLEFWTQAIALLRLWRELRSHDVVICHYPHYLLALDLLSLLRPRPVRVAISHGVFWDDAPGSLRSAAKAWLTRLAFRRAHLYIANDTNFLRAMGLRIAPRRRMFSQVAPGVWFIPNGVDTDRFRPTEPLPALRALNAILVPRNLYRNRGIHLAIDAYDLFRQGAPETKLFVVGGSGQPAYVRELQRDILRRGLDTRVIFHGRVPHDDLPPIYSAAQMTLIPSLCGEGTSLSALESMACGTATICTDVAGLRDLPGPHAAPNAYALAHVMRQVYADREQIGEDQRRQVHSTYSLANWRRAWARALAGVGMRLPMGERPEGAPVGAQLQLDL